MDRSIIISQYDYLLSDVNLKDKLNYEKDVSLSALISKDDFEKALCEIKANGIAKSDTLSIDTDYWDKNVYEENIETIRKQFSRCKIQLLFPDLKVAILFAQAYSNGNINNDMIAKALSMSGWICVSTFVDGSNYANLFEIITQTLCDVGDFPEWQKIMLKLCTKRFEYREIDELFNSYNMLSRDEKTEFHSFVETKMNEQR